MGTFRGVSVLREEITKEVQFSDRLRSQKGALTKKINDLEFIFDRFARNSVLDIGTL